MEMTSGVEVLSKEQIEAIKLGLSINDYENMREIGLEVIKGENYWHDEHISDEQAANLIDYYCLTGEEAQNYDCAVEYLKKYYLEW